jgi:hypothetical protein
MPVFRATWHGLKESLNFFERLGLAVEQIVGRGVGRAAIRSQDIIRGHLENMVYNQPPAASGYQRTRTLMRSVHAASPSATHGADESRASGGMNLAATDPTDVIERRGGQIASEAGSWIARAAYVHAGVNQPQPRPFVQAAVPAAEAALEEEVMAALLQEFAKAPRG